MLGAPARVMPVVVKGHGSTKGKVGLKVLLGVSEKYPPQSVLGALHKGFHCACACGVSFDVVCGNT